MSSADLASYPFPLGPLWYWWAFLPACAVAFAVFRYGLHVTSRRAIRAAFWTKIVSGVTSGVLATTIGAIAFVAGPHATIAVGFLMIVPYALADTAVELLVLSLFKATFTIPSQAATILWVAIGNLVIMGCLFGSILLFPSLEHDWGRSKALTSDALAPVARQYADELELMSGMKDTLWQGEQVTKPELDPDWIDEQRDTALSRRFRDLAIVIQSGPGRSEVETTVLVGNLGGRNPVLWLFDEADDGYGCLQTGPCFARSSDDNGEVMYHTEFGYAATRYAISIIATLSEQD